MAVLIQTTILMVGLVLTPPSATVVGGTVAEAVSQDSQDPDDEVALPQETNDEPAVVHAGTNIDGAESPATAHVKATSWQELSPAYHEPSFLPISGRAMYYNPGIMELVLGNRLEAGNVQLCDECIGYAAMLRVGDLNRKVWIELPDGTIEGPFHVIDTADVKHVPLLLARNWVIDVDHETAMRWRMAGPRDVTVLDHPPRMYPAQPSHPELLPVDLVPPEVDPIDIYRRTKMKHTSSVGEYIDEIDGLHLK